MGYHQSFKTVTITRQKYKSSQPQIIFKNEFNDSQITAKIFIIIFKLFVELLKLNFI